MANFVRKSKSLDGSTTIFMNDKDTIKIEGREVYSTDDKKEIEVLRNDPEIEEVSKKTKIEIEEE